MYGDMDAIGGYFSWEFSMNKVKFPHEEGVLVNSGHGALQLILQHIEGISKIWIPYFTCDIVPDSLKAINVPYDFYHINFELEIEELPDLNHGEYLLYTNYFGIMDGYVSALANRYGNQLIIDNAQAFFTPAIKVCHQIYSPRKFVGVPDGGIAVSPLELNIEKLPINITSNHCAHLLIRAEGNVTEGYGCFQNNDNALRDQPLAVMSGLTKEILHTLDYQEIIETRRKNYAHLHSELKGLNGFTRLLEMRGPESFTCPMVYPFYNEDLTLRSRLIKNKVFVATYWPNVLEWCSPRDTEYAFCNHIIPLPVDQRYGEKEMEVIIKIVENK